MAAAEHGTRLELVEYEVKAIKGTLGDVVVGLNGLRDAVMQLPKQSSTRDRMMTVSATIAIYTAIIALLNGWLGAQLAPDRQTLARVEQSVEGMDVVKYRLSLLEKRATP